jgi:hypothetical protein
MVDGLVYRSSMLGDTDAIVIFERAARPGGKRLPARLLLNRSLADPYILNPLLVAARGIGYRLI